MISNNTLYLNQNNVSEAILEFEGNPIDIKTNENDILFCTTNTCYDFSQSMEYNILDMPMYENFLINNYYKDDNALFLAIKNGGICSLSLDDSFDPQYFILSFFNLLNADTDRD